VLCVCFVVRYGTIVQAKRKVKKGRCAVSPLDKMWSSFVAIGLMAGASVLIVYARSRTRRIVRVLGTIVATMLLLLAIVYALAALV
jgi:hypothetical protein